MLKYAKIVPIDDCTGCESCKASCSHAALQMRVDARGFNYPYIETDRCIECGACFRACPVANKSEKDIDNPLKIVACRSNSTEILKHSSSGGIFTELASCILSQNGVVCGAAFDEKFNVQHIVVDTQLQLAQLRGSKYVQSAAGNGMAELRLHTLKGRKGFFIGTPCQVAGMKSLLGDKFSKNCLLVEVACHGVPSPMVFNRYKQELESRYNSKIKSINFRDKCNGWRDYRMTVCFQDGQVYSKPGHLDPYVSGFVEDFYTRKSCFKCRFKAFKSGADLTIGDFWGIENIDNGKYADNKGVSVVSINTAQGLEVFNLLDNMLSDVTEVALDAATAKNPCLVQSTKWNQRTLRFFRYIRTEGFSQALINSRRDNIFDIIGNCLRYRLGLNK